MKTISKRKTSGTLGQMVLEVNPVQFAKMRNRMLIAAKNAVGSFVIQSHELSV